MSALVSSLASHRTCSASLKRMNTYYSIAISLAPSAIVRKSDFCIRAGKATSSFRLILSTCNIQSDSTWSSLFNWCYNSTSSTLKHWHEQRYWTYSINCSQYVIMIKCWTGKDCLTADLLTQGLLTISSPSKDVPLRQSIALLSPSGADAQKKQWFGFRLI